MGGGDGGGHSLHVSRLVHTARDHREGAPGREGIWVSGRAERSPKRDGLAQLLLDLVVVAELRGGGVHLDLLLLSDGCRLQKGEIMG